MKMLRMSLLLIMLFSLMSGICYGQTAEDYCDKGIAYFNKGMFDKAIAKFKKAIEINSAMDMPGSATSWHSLIQSLMTCQVSLLSSFKEDIEAFGEVLNSVGDDCQLAKLDLQARLQKQQQRLLMMSNISKMMHDTAKSIIRNIK